jgi:hypothetical protein
MPTLLALSDISISHQHLIIEYTIPLLYHLLPDKIENEEIPYKLTLEAFERLSISPLVFFAAQEKLLNKFETTLKCKTKKNESEEERRRDLNNVCLPLDHDRLYNRSIISTLLRIIQTKDVQKHSDIKQYIKSIVFRLVKLVIIEDLSPSKDDSVILANEILNVICRILLIIFKNLEAR